MKPRWKSQIQNSKSQINSKHQRFNNSVIGIWDLFVLLRRPPAIRRAGIRPWWRIWCLVLSSHYTYATGYFFTLVYPLMNFLAISSGLRPYLTISECIV
jgi:hypothetical protein